MYKSPIEIKLNDIISDAVGKADEYIVKCVQQVCVNVDKDELIKALEYDRGQYEKGWNDRDNEIVRCKDCKHFSNYLSEEKADGVCWHNNADFEVTRNHFCSWGERREDGNT